MDTRTSQKIKLEIKSTNRSTAPQAPDGLEVVLKEILVRIEGDPFKVGQTGCPPLSVFVAR